MSYPLTQLGGSAFNSAHKSQSASAEAEYDRLRSLARHEHDLRSKLSSQSQNAYSSGDGAAAHSLSEQAKSHAAAMADYNRQASEYIFRENNAPGRVKPDEIDLHGQFVEEAEDIVEKRIRAGQERGEQGLHVIVGRGNHSADHVQKIKPRVESVCKELGLQYRTEDNEGRMYVDLRPGAGGMAPPQNIVGQGHTQGWQGHGGGYGGPPQLFGNGNQQQQGGQQYGQGAQGQQGGQGQNNQNEELDKLARKFLPKIIKKLEGCCVVM